MLTFSRAVPDFTLPANTQSIFEGVMRFTLVQTDLGAALHVGVQQPFDYEQGALDAADLPQRYCKFMLARLCVVTCNHNRFGLQSSWFSTRINCVYSAHQTRINCE